jgi:malonate-semialdehyde dehydrogenase (acetylating) / methylmalonate-semialdehyde dehydrogenase
MLTSELFTPVRDVPHWVADAPTSDPAARTLEVTNSATGEVCARLGVADGPLVDRTVAVAAQAGREWGRASIAARTRVLFRFRELVAGNADRLAALLTQEHGKVPVRRAG